MGTWNSRGLRGSTLEDLVNHTNEYYLERGLALIQKIPTPITPVKIDKEHRHITLAYFDQVSTVDYIGAVQGIPVCFDAKECAADTFPLRESGSALLYEISGIEKILGSCPKRRSEKLPPRRTGSRIFHEIAEGETGALSGLPAERSGSSGMILKV